MKYLRKFPNLDGYSIKELELPFPCVSFINDELAEEVIFEPTPNYIVCEYEITPEDMEANKNGIMVYYGNEGEIDEVAINGEIVEIEKAEIIESAMAYETQTLNGVSYRVPTKENRIFGGEAIKEYSVLFTENESITPTVYLYTLTFENDILIDFSYQFTDLSNRLGIDEKGARIIPQSYYEWMAYEPSNYSFAFVYHNLQEDFTNGLEPKDIVSKIHKTYLPLITIPYESLTENKLYEVKFRYEKYENLLANKFIHDYMVSFDMSETNENYPFILGDDIMSNYGSDSRLKYIKLDNIEEMRGYAFDNHPFVEEFIIGKNVQHINTDDNWPFYSANLRGEFIVDKRNPHYDSREDCNCIIETATNNLIRGNSNSFIPDTVEELDEAAFAQCVDLTHITIPSSVKYMGELVFDGCTALTSITCDGYCPQLREGYESYGFGGVGENGILRVPFYTNYSAWMEELSELGWTLETFVPDDFEDEVIMTSESNPRVMEVCYNQGWAANPDLMMKSEAMMVEDIGTAFAGRKDSSTNSSLNTENVDNIYSFDELQYFTSLQEIPDYAFKMCANLSSITLPTSVVRLGDEAFYGTQLESMIIPEHITTLGEYVFKNCSELTSLVFNNQISSVSGSLCYGCKNLSSVTLSNSIDSIGPSAFHGCSNLKQIDILDSVTNIGAYAFRESGVEDVNISSNVVEVGDYAFAYSALKRAMVNAQNIRWCAFYRCYDIEHIELGDNVQLIEKEAFYQSGDAENSELIISSGTIASSGCYETNFDTVILGDNVDVSAKAFYSSNIKTIQFSDNISSIGESAFSGSTQLTSVTLPNSLTSLSSSVFRNCWDLQFINFGTSLESIGDYAFAECRSLTSVTFGENVKSIGTYAFDDCSALTQIDMLDSVTSIGAYAFNNCSGLTSVYIPQSVQNISNNPFKGCASLESISVDANNVGFSDGGNNYLKHTESGALISACRNTVLDNTITRITANSFYKMQDLTSITLPDSVTRIDASAFTSCINLESVIISNGVTMIGDSAFESCSGLTSLIIPENVTSIGNYAFRNCSNLASITCKAITPPSIYSWTFRNVKPNGVLYYPQGSDYSQWMKTSSYYLGYSNWTSQEITVE